MQGVITRVHVLAHPIVIVESFGVKVFARALFASARETFLEIVSRCAEEDEHRGQGELDLARTVKRYIGIECRVRDIYRALAAEFAGDPEAARFFKTLAGHEEGHALVLSRVRREIRRGRLWKDRRVHFDHLEGLEARLASFEEAVRRGVTLARALDIVEAIEGSEVNVVFDTLNGCVDMRSRAAFERFFVLTGHHLAFVAEQVRALRARAPARAGAAG